MKTYTVLFAEDVPHYGTAEIQAADDGAALEAAKNYDLSEVTNDAEWNNSACKRIVDIQDSEGNVIAEDISLDNCFLRYGGDKERRLCDAAQEMLDALELCEDALSDLARIDDGTPSISALNAARAALAKAKGRQPMTAPEIEPFRVPVKLFDLGHIVSTPGALEACSPAYMSECLTRHIQGDWGIVGAEDPKANFEALFNGGRILSAYPIDPAKPCKGFGANTLWIITEANRSATTFLLPKEY